MKYVNLRPNVLASFLLLASCASFGVTLGNVRGGALIGRTLDVTVPVRLDRGEDPGSLCIETELAYSEAGIDSRKVSVMTSAAVEPGQANIRITSSAIVDEPVVTLLVRAGCSIKNSRRYVLLADLPVDAAQGFLPAAPFASGISSGGGTKAERELSQEGSQRTNRSGPDSRSSTGRSPSQAIQTAPRRARVVPSSVANDLRSASGAPRSGSGSSALSQSLRLGESTPPNPGASRLRLDSAELQAETSPSLKSAAELTTAPAETDARRTEFAALWRILNLRPEEVTRDLQRLEEVQSQARGLREANSKTLADLDSAREQLKRAEAERFANPLVYGLAALLALLLIGVAYLYLRSNKSSHVRTGGAWWDLREGDAANRREVRAMRDLVDGSPPAAIPALEVEPFASDLSKARPMDEKFQPGSRAGDSNYPSSGMAVSPRGVNVNELFDIAQQADFFVSLGQHDHAIEVLANHIRENAQTSPLAYLDLFKLFHELDRKPQYDELRVEFNRIFNAQVPAFEAFRERGEGLEAYDGAITRIQALWNTPKVLDVIEESIFRKPGRPADAFGLEAYRELLLLYAMAHELVDIPQNPQFESSDSPSFAPASSGFTSNHETQPDDAYTELQPLGASLGRPRVDVIPPTMPAEFDTERAGNFSLDVDLSEPWLDLGYSESDRTLVLPARKPGSFQPPSSAWLDFDLSEIGNDGEAGVASKTNVGLKPANAGKDPGVPPAA